MARLVALFALGLGSLLACGCYGDVESFVIAKAKQDCKRERYCFRASFVNNHDDDMSECRDDQEDFYFDAVDVAEAVGWEYDPDAGAECVQVSRQLRRDCSHDADEEIGDACREVIEDGF